MTDLPQSSMRNYTEVLDEMKADRGYLLSFHQFLSRTNLEYLVAYADYYKHATLKTTHLDAQTKETVWIAILSMVGDAVGSIHIERAIEVGIDQEARESIIRLASRAAVWPYLKTTSENWGRFQMPDPIKAYATVVQKNEDYLNLGIRAELVMLAASAVLRNKEPFTFHLINCLEMKFTEAQLVESLTFLVNPLGFNRLQWACDTWLKALADGTITKTELFTDGLPEARVK